MGAIFDPFFVTWLAATITAVLSRELRWFWQIPVVIFGMILGKAALLIVFPERPV